jgi:hypothetical protein
MVLMNVLAHSVEEQWAIWPIFLVDSAVKQGSKS